MLLLLQLNGDLPEHFPDEERRLYVFSCPRKTCNRKAGSVRALRGIKKLKTQSSKQEAEKPQPEPPKTTAAKPDLGSALFGGGSTSLGSNANPFSTSSSPSQNNPFAPLPSASTLAAKPPQTPVNSLSETFASKVRVSNPETPSSEPVAAGPVLPWPSQSEFPPPYTEYHLDAEYETLSRPSTPKIPTNTTIENIDTEDSTKGGSASDSKDTFESSLDKAFLRFSTRLGHNPEQVLRYEFRGTPLLYSDTDAVAKQLLPSSSSSSSHQQTHVRFPRCNSCGSERVFELQLVPHAITVLEEGREGIGLGKDDAGMEWGTIVLGVCAADCGASQAGQVGWREEWVGVQWEETK